MSDNKKRNNPATGVKNTPVRQRDVAVTTIGNKDLGILNGENRGPKVVNTLPPPPPKKK